MEMDQMKVEIRWGNCEKMADVLTSDIALCSQWENGHKKIVCLVDNEDLNSHFNIVSSVVSFTLTWRFIAFCLLVTSANECSPLSALAWRHKA